MEIDIVYTWVNGSDLKYIDTWNAYSKRKKDRNPERYRDSFELLRYSIRSLELYFPYYRNIYIVTARPQVPAWLNLSNERVHLIHHDQIIDAEYLPTFNSNVIESFLHNIPGISDHFLYLNDDHLFGAPCSLDRFYKENRYQVYNTFFGENLSWRLYDGYHDIVGLGLIEHNPIFINKHFWREAFGLFPEKTQQTRQSKFRAKTDFFPLKLYRYYLLKYHREICEPVPVFTLLGYHQFYKLTNELKKQRRMIEQLKNRRPEFYCLNDDMKGTPNPDVLRVIQEYLNEIYPKPSSYENLDEIKRVVSTE